MKKHIGNSLNRTSAILKVTGKAEFTAEIKTARTAFAFFAGSAIARGKIKSIDTRAAEKANGVIFVMTHLNSFKLAQTQVFQPGEKPTKPGDAAISVMPLQSDEIHFRGQIVACVVAETYEQARSAANLIKVAYAGEKPIADFEENIENAQVPTSVWGKPPTESDGAPDAALRQSTLKIDEIYVTPLENHHPLEPHATLAVWLGDELTVCETSRNVQGARETFAAAFQIPKENVRVIAKFVGGAFGEKGALRHHALAAAMCAKKINRPVKLALTRRQMTDTTGHRPVTRQRVALGADKEGKLLSIIHEGESSCSATDSFVEPFTTQTLGLYAALHRRVSQKVVHLNAAQPTTMRAPGEASGMFALESAMDELAYKLKIDPVELRKINEPLTEPVSGKEFSCRRLLQCIEKGAAQFEWQRRRSEPGTNREGDLLIGHGFAVSVYPLKGTLTKAKCRIWSDGSAVIESSTHDFGNGVETAVRQIAADALGIAVEKVSFEYGDSELPPAPRTGGSTATMWVGTAAKKACEAARAKVLALAKTAENKDYAEILTQGALDFIEAEAEAQPDEAVKKKYAMDSYGANFCEVAVSQTTGEVAVRRFTGVFNCGRIVNPKLARSQFVGSIVMGIGMALTEDNYLDVRNGKWLNADLGDYHVPVFADIRKIEALWLDEPDLQVNDLGIKGVGEIGIVGVAAAIANAVFNATGKRIRKLPIMPDKLA